MPIRLLMLSPYFGSYMSGLATAARSIGEELSKKGARIVWAAPGSPTHDIPIESVRQVPLAAFNPLERHFGLPLALLRPGAIRTIRREVRNADVVLVQNTSSLPSLFGLLLGLSCGKPVVVAQHGGHAPPGPGMTARLWRWLLHLTSYPLLSCATVVIYSSHSSLAEFRNVRLRLRPRLIFNGVDTEAFNLGLERSAARRALGIPEDASVVLFAGRLVAGKGMPVMKRLVRRLPSCLWIFAGEGAVDPQTWSASNIRVVGRVNAETLASLYRASDVLVLPSEREGFPLVMKEALACGLPVICSRAAADADPAARAHLTAVDLDLGDADATAARFQEQIERMCAPGAADCRAHRAAESNAFASSRYSWEGCGSAYDRLLRALVRRQSRVGRRGHSKQ